MKALARQMGGDPQRWELIGLLHDIDFERLGRRHGQAWRGRIPNAERIRVPTKISQVMGITRFMALGEFFSLALGAMQEIRGDPWLE